ncbi:MAG: serine hydrolase domain-containing protein [Victivallaceae bacterium]|nr:serine hydrolase domain-containing protein [Victivallaceae bacterium]
MRKLFLTLVACSALLTAYCAEGKLHLNKWRVAGPISEASWVEGEADRFLAEPMDKVCGAEVVDYVNPRDPDGDGLFFLDVFSNIPAGKSMAYAAVDFDATEDCYYLFLLNTDFTAEVFINGESQFKAVGTSFDNYFFAKLKKGTNRIAIKSWHDDGLWAVVLTPVEGPLNETECAALKLQQELASRYRQFSENYPMIDGYFVGTVGAQPVLTWQNPENAKAVLGDKPQKITWFDETMRPATDFSRPGLYYALVEADTVDGKPYKALFGYYLLKDGWKDDPEIVEFAKHFQWKEPFDAFSSTWCAMPWRLKRYLEDGDKELDWCDKPGISPAVVAWRQANFPVETVTLAPPEQLESPAPTLRYGTEAEAGFKPGSVEKFNALCKEWYEKSDNAFYCIIARNGVIVYARGFGEVNGKPIDIITPCSMASMSKFFTGLLFARFLDQKLIDLDENMVRFMPALANTPEKELTPRRCFNHTGGFSGHGNFGGIRNPLGDYGIACWLAGITPGRDCNYNGVGPNLMGMYMMNATATPIDKLFENNYYRQLGITSMHGDDQGGGYVASADDLAKLAQLMLNKGSYGKWKFFSPETYEQMMPRDIKADNPGIKMTTTWFFGWYGTGIHPFRKPEAGDDPVAYYGHGAASFTLFEFDPKYKTMIVQSRDENKNGTVNNEYRAKLEDLVWSSVVR